MRPRNAVAALLVLDNGRYVMQLRDARAGIFYPGHWGCFGGALDKGERPREALVRELREELEFTVARAQRFTRFDFDFSRLGQPKVFRIYYEIRLERPQFRRLVLHEGAAVRAFSGPALLKQRPVTPYDAFAVWLHMSRLRFR